MVYPGPGEGKNKQIKTKTNRERECEKVNQSNIPFHKQDERQLHDSVNPLPPPPVLHYH